MPSLIRFLHISAALCTATSLAFLMSGCSSTGNDPASAPRPDSVSAGITVTATPSAGRTSTAPAPAVPADVEKTARAFAIAYAQHDATDGGDQSYAAAGSRAARYATGDLVEVLAQQRVGQEAPWHALRSEKARQAATVTSVVVPDGAPAVTSSSALVRVGYTLTTTPQTGPARKSAEQLALRLERTADGWRVVALPWA
ncbi:hypothetical protein ACFCY8_13155 [Streptomyces noursei]|uniref:hypothetical protein n=1 Tax=Streptomyces noursei TaxID=1971 RepID=UPI0035D8C033